MLTGILKYHDEDYLFVFQEGIDEMELIPADTRSTIQPKTDFHLNGITADFEPMKMDAPFLIGNINENQNKIVFVTIKNSNIKQVNNVLYVKLYAYFLLEADDNGLIDKLTLESPEIDHIFSVNRAFNFSFQDIKDFNRKGTVTIKTNDFDSTSSHPQYFKVEDKEISLSFQINRTISTAIGKPPLIINSVLCFEFEPTDDYLFIINLCHYARNFIRFLCFRKNIYFTSVDIYKPIENNKHQHFGKISLFEDNQKSEIEPIETNRCIKYEYIMGNEGTILNDIATNQIYLRHLPKSYEDGKHIDVSSFIMITSAFEWEFSRNYPDGIIKKESTLKAEKAVSEAVSELLEKSTGKQKNIYNFLLRLVYSDPLQSKIIQFGKDYSNIIDDFGKYMYNLNQIDFNYKDIGERVSAQRNHFAHGDLHQEFINEALLDVVFLKEVVYVLQLKRYGLSDENIRRSINDVFRHNFAL
ncbi:MAG: hypothetical protein IK999_01490 [Ruminococcus sp.]|nr:hypothetical protein [Ruminococcus sp.]